MQRRKFLKIFGIGLGAATIPTATAAKAALTPPTEPAPDHDALGNIPAAPEPPADADEALLAFHPEPITIPKSLQKLISQCAREQVHAMNGDDCGSQNFDKAYNALFWQRLADQHINDIEDEAKILGLTTTWPGMYPEFTRPSPQT